MTPTRLWVGTWVTASIVNGGIFLASREVDQPSPVAGSVAVLLQLAATAGLLYSLGRIPTETLTAAPVTRRGALGVAIGLVVLALFPIGATGLLVLVPVGVAAAIVLLVLRRPSMSGREIGYSPPVEAYWGGWRRDTHATSASLWLSCPSCCSPCSLAGGWLAGWAGIGR